jgi:hypothetical protein
MLNVIFDNKHVIININNKIFLFYSDARTIRLPLIHYYYYMINFRYLILTILISKNITNHHHTTYHPLVLVLMLHMKLAYH